MRRIAGPAIEVQPRLATIVPECWPVKVLPAHDELLSSWLHRLALAHGLSPRHFGECLGVGAGAWSMRLHPALPEFVLNLLHHQTGVGRDRIAAMTIGAEKWRPLLLPFRRARADRTGATWLQFCPACLADDETPYFRRSWRRASVISCRRHRCGLLDRCPACGQGLAPFNQRGLVPQHRCRLRIQFATSEGVQTRAGDAQSGGAARRSGPARSGKRLPWQEHADQAYYRPAFFAGAAEQRELREAVDGRANPLRVARRKLLRSTIRQASLRRARRPDHQLAMDARGGGRNRRQHTALAASVDVAGRARKRPETKEQQSQRRRGRQLAFIVGGLWRRPCASRGSNA